MLPTTCIIYCGVRLEVPLIDGVPLDMPFDSWDGWDISYCGAGHGVAEWVVPEKFPGGSIATPCCYIHDFSNDIAETVQEYAQSDRMFLTNLIAAVLAHHPLDIVGKKEHTDLLWAISYYMAVDSTK